MIDIVSVPNGNNGDDLGLLDSQVPKASNILSVQLDSLEYTEDFGIDLKYFLDENFNFQNESFKSYLINRLAAQNINISSVLETVSALFNQYTFNIKPAETGGLIAR